MLAFTTAALTQLLFFPPPNLTPSSLPQVALVDMRAGMRQQWPDRFSNFALVREKNGSSFLGFLDSRSNGFSGFVMRCQGWDSGGDLALEAEILEFMHKSSNPQAFPSKKDLVEAGRLDLVEGIVRQGGWLSLGWDLDEQENNRASDFTYWDLDERGSNQGYEGSASSGDEIGVSGMVSDDDSSQAASSSGRPIEAATTEAHTGIEGILSRLEKQRNLTLGFVLKEKEDSNYLPNDKYDWSPATDATVAPTNRSKRPASLNGNEAIFDDPVGRPNHSKSLSNFAALQNSSKPELWRTWIAQRAGSSNLDFEAGEISYAPIGGTEGHSQGEILQIKEGSSEPDEQNVVDSDSEVIDYKQVRSHMQHLESELSSVLSSLRAKTNKVADKEGHESSSDNVQQLSDAWEFQENEIMHAQNKLRSTRAKLAVLEGKMALAVINAQKMAEGKLKRVNDARRALRLLRTASVVWTNSASEVLLTGSFDGWTTKRKMGKSSTGIFSLSLQLYPGRYEIKFIVDGEWRIDPLRPIVLNNGHQNNVLIIT